MRERPIRNHKFGALERAMGLEPFMLPFASMNLLKNIDDIFCHAELWNKFKVLQQLQLIVYFATSAKNLTPYS